MVPHRDCPRLADHRELAPEVLVAPDIGLMDAAQVAAGQKHRPAHLTRRVVGKIKELDIEVLAWVNDIIGVPDLPLFVARPHFMANLVPYLLPEVLLSQAQIQLFATPLPCHLNDEDQSTDF